MNYPKWTAQEDNKIINAVKRHPENINYAFFLLSKRINRTPGAISVRYYTAIRPNLPKDEPIIFTGSPKKFIPNTKSVQKNKKTEKFTILKSTWNKILHFITEY